ncbi:hypothetical protein [Natronomonas sp.]|uniref:hypothetical protein n=1 Tax=Natronomonas sp. TaxID=2184060 RepID=UPI002FC3C4B5
MSRSGVRASRHVEEDRQFPAYGPIEAVLGYLLFYVIVGRVTPAVVTVFSETVLDLSPSVIRLGLAAALWFVLAVTVIDQARRQLAALGFLTYEDLQLRVWSRVSPWSLRTAGYLLAFVAGTAVAAATFEAAVEALLSLIPVVATIDAGAFDVLAFSLMVVFFLAYSIAAHALDRLVIDGIRVLTAG